MEVRLVRAELQKCYKAEGVNHLQVCKALAERYLKMTRENKVSANAREIAVILAHPACASLKDTLS